MTDEPIKYGRSVLRLPHLYDKQREAIFAPERYAIIEASTKSGKTVGCIVWIMAMAWESKVSGRNFWWVAPIRSQAKIAYRRMVAMLNRTDPNKEIWDNNATELWISFANGSVIWFKGSDDPDSLYGEDVYGAVIDEATRCKEEAWIAVRSTITATRGPVRIIGNVKGRKNWAFRMARKAEAGAKNHSYAKLTAYDAVEGGVLDADEIEDAKATLVEHVFRELYLAEPSDDGGNPFGGVNAIAECIMPKLAEGPVAYWGVDLAKSVDWTVAIGLNAYGKMCAFQRWQSNWLNTIKRLQMMIAQTPALIDSTGVGDPIVEGIQQVCSLANGYIFTNRSKQQLMEGLASSIHQRIIGYIEGVIVIELESFEYEYRAGGRVFYSAPEGMHDDCVCGLALADRCRTLAPAALSFSSVGGEPDDPPMTEAEMLNNDAIWSDFDE